MHAVILFLFVCFIVHVMFCLAAAHPHFPPQLSRRRLQDLFYFQRKQTKTMMKRELALFIGEKVYSNVFRKTQIN